ncbi:MAG TPA: site-specific integrase [Methylococcaceae bacterium]|nr:site-specific integrase [Methylococcaceae bacterium]
MQAKIGNSLVARLIPETKPYEIRDTQLKGFLLRVQPSGAMSYIVEYRRGKRLTLGPVGVLTPVQARDRAKEVLADVVHGKDPQAEKRAAKVDEFKDFLAHEYGPWVKANRKDGAATLARLNTCFQESFGEKKLADINAWIAEKWRATRLNGGASTATINRDLAALKACLSKAVEWGFLGTHPLAGFKLSKLDQHSTVRYLTDEEEAALRQALDARESRLREERQNANAWRQRRRYPLLPDLSAAAFADHLKPMVLISLNTGLRQGELFGLTWEAVNLERAHLTIHGHNAKSGRTRHIPLNAEALETLQRWRRQDAEGLVFASKGGKTFDNVRKAWVVVLKTAGIERFRWHDMRHHFASRLVMAGVDLNTVRELLGHSDITMTLRYAHLAPEHKAAAVAKLVRLPQPANTGIPAFRKRSAGNGADVPA